MGLCAPASLAAGGDAALALPWQLSSVWLQPTGEGRRESGREGQREAG